LIAVEASNNVLQVFGLQAQRIVISKDQLATEAVRALVNGPSISSILDKAVLGQAVSQQALSLM
jgi:hypothetical protein